MSDYIIRICEEGSVVTYEWAITYEAETGQKTVVLVEVA